MRKIQPALGISRSQKHITTRHFAQKESHVLRTHGAKVVAHIFRAQNPLGHLAQQSSGRSIIHYGRCQRGQIEINLDTHRISDALTERFEPTQNHLPHLGLECANSAGQLHLARNDVKSSAAVDSSNRDHRGFLRAHVATHNRL